MLCLTARKYLPTFRKRALSLSWGSSSRRRPLDPGDGEGNKIILGSITVPLQTEEHHRRLGSPLKHHYENLSSLNIITLFKEIGSHFMDCIDLALVKGQ